MSPAGASGQTGCGGNEGAVNRGDGDRLTGRGRDMGLEAQSGGGDSVSSRADGGEPRGEEDELHGVSGGGRDEELDDIGGTNGSRGLVVTSDGRDGVGRVV